MKSPQANKLNTNTQSRGSRARGLANDQKRLSRLPQTLSLVFQSSLPPQPRFARPVHALRSCAAVGLVLRAPVLPLSFLCCFDTCAASAPGVAANEPAPVLQAMGRAGVVHSSPATSTQVQEAPEPEFTGFLVAGRGGCAEQPVEDAQGAQSTHAKLDVFLAKTTEKCKEIDPQRPGRPGCPERQDCQGRPCRAGARKNQGRHRCRMGPQGDL